MSSTPIAKMVREMIAKGVDPDVIELAVATAEMTAAPVMSGGSPVDTAAEKRRAYDRERKAKERDVHRTSGGIPRTSESVSLSKDSKKEEIEERETPKRTFRGTRLVDDWAPNADDWRDATVRLGEQGSVFELSKYRDYWKSQPGQKGVKLDWDATWRNWIRNARGAANGAGTSGLRPNPPSQQSGSAPVLAGVAAATERRARERSAAGQQRPLPVDPDPAPRDDIDLFRADGGAAAHR